MGDIVIALIVALRRVDGSDARQLRVAAFLRRCSCLERCAGAFFLSTVTAARKLLAYRSVSLTSFLPGRS